MNPTVVRGVATAVAGLLTISGIIPDTMRDIIVANAEAAVGAVATLWGIVAAIKGARKPVA